MNSSSTAGGRVVAGLRIWAFVLALLLAEAHVFTDHFRGEELLRIDASWTRAVLALPALVPCAIAMIGGVLLFGRPALIELLSCGSRQAPSKWVTCLAVHACSVPLFFQATSRLFELGDATGIPLASALGFWFGSGIAVVSSLLLLCFSPRNFARIKARDLTGAIFGLAAGGLAWTVGQAGQTSFWSVLSVPTLMCVRASLRLLMPSTVMPASGELVGVGDFVVRIGPDCSGYEGIGLVWIFLCSYLWIARHRLRFPRAFWLLPLGTALVWTLNIARIVALVIIGDRWSPRLAIGAFHTRMGWVLFCLVALGIVTLVERSKLFLIEAPQLTKAKTRERLEPAYLLPLFLVLSAQLVVGAFVIDEATAYLASLPIGVAVLLYYRKHYKHLRPSWSWPAALAGCLVFVVWISFGSDDAVQASDTALAVFGASAPVGPAVSTAQLLSSILIAPIVEELAFRGYLMRRLISKQVELIRIGTYTLYSCIASSVLFGITHDRWFVGILAGIVYAAVLCRERKLSHAVLAHVVTNGLLAIWQFG